MRIILTNHTTKPTDSSCWAIKINPFCPGLSTFTTPLRWISYPSKNMLGRCFNFTDDKSAVAMAEVCLSIFVLGKQEGGIIWLVGCSAYSWFSKHGRAWINFCFRMSNFRFINFYVLRCYYVSVLEDIEGFWRRLFSERNLLEYSWVLTFLQSFCWFILKIKAKITNLCLRKHLAFLFCWPYKKPLTPLTLTVTVFHTFYADVIAFES